MSGTLAEGRGDLGVRLAPAAVAVGEVGHSEDAGQQRQMYQPEQTHDELGVEDQMRQSMKTSPPNRPRGRLAAYFYNITTFLYNIIIQ